MQTHRDINSHPPRARHLHVHPDGATAPRLVKNHRRSHRPVVAVVDAVCCGSPEGILERVRLRISQSDVYCLLCRWTGMCRFCQTARSPHGVDIPRRCPNGRKTQDPRERQRGVLHVQPQYPKAREIVGFRPGAGCRGLEGGVGAPYRAWSGTCPVCSV